MQIVAARPPNFDEIAAVFPEAHNPGVMFCYGDVVYSPSGIAIPAPLIAHEEVHSVRQREVSVQTWWDRYLSEAEFRFHEELPAHIVEFKRFREDCKSVEKRAEYLRRAAQRLSSPLYGSMIGLADARRTIERGRRG